MSLLRSDALPNDPQRWVYELKLLQPNGGLMKLEVDARDGTVLRQREEKR